MAGFHEGVELQDGGASGGFDQLLMAEGGDVGVEEGGGGGGGVFLEQAGRLEQQGFRASAGPHSLGCGGQRIHSGKFSLVVVGKCLPGGGGVANLEVAEAAPEGEFIGGDWV